jgi:hypothetical protein
MKPGDRPYHTLMTLQVLHYWLPLPVPWNPPLVSVDQFAIFFWQFSTTQSRSTKPLKVLPTFCLHVLIYAGQFFFPYTKYPQINCMWRDIAWSSKNILKHSHMLRGFLNTLYERCMRWGGRHGQHWKSQSLSPRPWPTPTLAWPCILEGRLFI